MVQLRDGSILCTTYGWALMRGDAAKKMKAVYRHEDFVFLGGSLLRSKDSGHSWQGPFIPPPTPGETVLDPFAKPVPAYNRGAMCQGKDGKLYWVVAARTSPGRTSTHLFISSNQGDDWTYACPVATDDKVTFNESSIYETPKGDLVAFMRTADFDDHTAVARSVDGGKSFRPGRMPAFRDIPITWCGCRTGGCCWSMGIGTLLLVFAPARWTPNAPTSPRPPKSFCATMAAMGIWVTPGPRCSLATGCWSFITSTSTTAPDT